MPGSMPFHCNSQKHFAVYSSMRWDYLFKTIFVRNKLLVIHMPLS